MITRYYQDLAIGRFGPVLHVVTILRDNGNLPLPTLRAEGHQWVTDAFVVPLVFPFRIFKIQMNVMLATRKPHLMQLIV